MKKLTFKRTVISAIALTSLLNAMPLIAHASYTGGVTRTAALTQSAVSVPASSTTFTFSNSGVSVSGDESGYKVEGTALTIQEPGVYTITGTCAEGSITVKKGTTGVTLILQDLTLASSVTAPLSCNKETDVTVYAVGAVTLTDKESLANEDSDDFEGAAIKVKSGASLTITGTGTLNADGSACKNGIKGAAESVITVQGAVTLNVKAANNGIADDNAVVINSGTVNVTASGDGIKAEPDTDDAVSKGIVTINGGSVTIRATGDGIQATGDVTITGGAFDIQTHGGASYAKQLGSDDSAKGIKSDSKVIISGGTFALNSADDAVHANGNVIVSGGSYTVQAGDDAFHADYDLTLGEKGGNGPEITVSGSYEGLEGARIYLNSGKGTITASDDGVNAATDVSTNEIALYINGGEWTIDAGGDGLDAGGDSRNNSGGSVYINGGVTKVFGSANGGNAALDYDGTCEYNGGALLTVDVSGMNMQPSAGTYVLFGAASGMGGGMMGQPGQMGGAMGQQSGNMSGMTGQQSGNMGGMTGQQSGMGQRGNMSGQQSGNQRAAVFTANVSESDSMARMGGMTGQPGNMGGMGQQSVSGQSAMGQQSGAMNQGSTQQTMTASTGSVSISKGSTIEVKDSAGNTIISATGTKTANVVMLCDDSLVSGETYTLYVNGSAAATATATSGGQSGGVTAQPEQQSFNPEQSQPGQNQTFNPEQAQPGQPTQTAEQSAQQAPEQNQAFNPEQAPSTNNAPMGQQGGMTNNAPTSQQNQAFNPEQASATNNAPMGQQGGMMNNGPMGQQN
ncbi:MAG: carbohydrate-binding domain-containing protein, partial [Oscillibacter sp.]|nr:carbohydrate-binding domain-containing protein [Oscillibacter sp.]